MISINSKIRVGLDLGSKTLKAAILNRDILEETFIYDHRGNLVDSLGTLLFQIRERYKGQSDISYGICSSREIKGLNTIDSMLAAVEANRFLGTQCRNIIGIGCETFYLIMLDEKGNYREHRVNPMCASGTGSFLDQQAERIGLTIDELSRRAFAYEGKTPTIATRCAVFAKSDIIHAQAEGYGPDAIAAGLCRGMAGSIVSQLKKGRDLKGGTVLTGGVSRNNMIAREISNLIEGDIKIIESSVVFNAIGAAILGQERELDPEKLAGFLGLQHERRIPLEITLTDYPDFSSCKTVMAEGVEITEYSPLTKGHKNLLLGIDIGSTSTKALVMDYDSRVIFAGLYTRTAGAPVGAVKKIFSHLERLLGETDRVIRGVGTTGSGRNLIKEILNADMVVNEITAHARGALFLDPQVDTIIEIGGQDSKFTRLDQGEVVNAVMNYVCAAGTGSFIEEQAQRLDISLDEITSMAMGQRAPYTSDRCTVYMERDLNMFSIEGFNKEEIITAVLHSVRDNYLSKVVGKLSMGERIFFQGATARNKALVAAFEQALGKPVSVSPYCHLTGALGAAIMAGALSLERSGFTGLHFDYTQDKEICTLCHNRCELSLFTTGSRTTAWGLKCGRDYEEKKYNRKKTSSHLENSFTEIFRNNEEYEQTRSLTVGLIKGLYQAEFYPLFEDFFRKLGLDVVLQESGPQIINEGHKLVNSDFCAPMVVTHGMVDRLLKRGVDFIFIPSLVNEVSPLLKEEEKLFREKERDSYFCYYSSYAPSILYNLVGEEDRSRIISPNLFLDDQNPQELADLVAQSLNNRINDDRALVAELFIESLDQFRQKQGEWKQLGRLKRNSDREKMKIMLLGRPYSVFDRQVNLGIPGKLEDLGFDLLYQSMVDLEETDCPVTGKFLEKMHWFYGQEILKAAETAARSDNIYPVFLSCFRCSPDSYLLTYVKEIFKAYNKPYLVIQLDEHASDVGYQTRIEAAVDTFKSHFLRNKSTCLPEKEKGKGVLFAPGDTVLIPFVSDIVSALQAEAFRANGYESAVVPLDAAMINRGYRYASGGECMPNVAIIGSMMEYIERNALDTERCTVYLPGLCMSCNFNQYAVLFENACDNSECRGLKIYNGSTIQKIPGLPQELNLNVMEAGIIGGLLYKLFFRFVPYEKIPGSVKEALNKGVDLVSRAMREKASLPDTLRKVRTLFELIELKEVKRKPRAILVGDFYAKYNNILNHNLTEEIVSLGAEVIIPSYTETVNHFLYEDYRNKEENKKFHKGFVLFEKRYELIFKGLLEEEIMEPPMEECTRLADMYSCDKSLAGETSISLGRVLYMLTKRQIEAIVHINPVFCCPGVVSSSIFQRIREEYDIPVIDLFYDGNNRPNEALKPQLYYLCRNS